MTVLDNTGQNAPLMNSRDGIATFTSDTASSLLESKLNNLSRKYSLSAFLCAFSGE